MTTAKTAQNILDENNYSTDDCDLTDLEGLMDLAISYVNAVALQSIGALTGAGGAKTTGALTDAQLAAFYPLTVMLLRAHVDRGPNTNVLDLNVSTVIADPQYSTYKMMFDMAVTELRRVGSARKFQRA